MAASAWYPILRRVVMVIQLVRWNRNCGENGAMTHKAVACICQWPVYLCELSSQSRG